MSNIGFVQNYQSDVFGNEFALFKGYNEVWVEDGRGGKVLDHIEVPERYYPEREYPDERDEHTEVRDAYIINGGYFEDPYFPGRVVSDGKGNSTYVPGRKFDHRKKLTINEFYHWTGLKLGIAPLVTPDILYPGLIFGEFGCTQRVKYIDHFQYTESTIDRLGEHDDIVEELLKEFASQLETEGTQDGVPIKKVKKSFLELAGEEGTLFIKNNEAYENRPLSLANTFTWLPQNLSSKKIINYWVKKQVLIYETAQEFVFAPYSYENGKIVNNLGLNELIVLPKNDLIYADPLWNEKEQVFYFVFFNKIKSSTNLLSLAPSFYKFNPIDYSLELIVSSWRLNETVKQELAILDKQDYFPSGKFNRYQTKIKSYSTSILDQIFFVSSNNLENFNYPYQEDTDFGKIIFTYNNNLGLYLIAYLITDNNGISYIYEHKFKLSSDEAFNNTLVSNVYSIIGGTTAKTEYNEKIDSGLVTPSGSSRFFISLP